jgi:superfamily II DNA or RNA helicase
MSSMTWWHDISASLPPNAAHSAKWWWGRPTIVAESLAPVPDPLVTALVAGPAADPISVARNIARSLLPDEAPAAPPAWLLPDQVTSFRRALAALRRYRGALLADPVGSGKTYVALAVAAEWNRGRPSACLVPATLREQWCATAARLGVPVVMGSHQQASRGRLPANTGGLVVIDESHHFRNPATRRYAHVAPWLRGRPALLVTATPMVNRLKDLAHQLLLTMRDDALATDAVISLRALLAGGWGSPALGRVVVENTIEGRRPERRTRGSPADPGECEALGRALSLIARLRLSRSASIAALFRAVLQRAAGSSPAALAGALRRYRSLLLHARDALRAGRGVERAAIRRFTGELEDQLILWELMPGNDNSGELELDDLAVIEEVIAEAVKALQTPDPKLERLRRLVADDLPTVVFTARRETVRHLRDGLAPTPVAWCTGERAGLGPAALPRSTVLSWFRADPPRGAAVRPPRLLVVTDVAAEGLDLQLAGRVVHYDLAWTPMRMEQREGRALRLGSPHAAVDVVRFDPPPALERALAIGATLERKGSLPARAGLGPSGGGLWRWRWEIASAMGNGPAVAGVATVKGRGEGVLAGFVLEEADRGPEGELAQVVVWIEPDGRWTEDPEIVSQRLRAASAKGRSGAPDSERLRAALRLVAVPVRARLALGQGSRWAAAEPAPGARDATARLQRAVRDAARRRDAAGLARLERGIGFVSGGHTAGETRLIAELALLSDAELYRAAARFPAPTRRPATILPRLTGIVLFEME